MSVQDALKPINYKVSDIFSLKAQLNICYHGGKESDNSFERFSPFVSLSFFCRPCVYTVGSPINNRALFPCQEPPVAMSTWQATVRAAASFVVLMSGENSAKPTQLQEGTVHVFCASLCIAHMLDPGTQYTGFFSALKELLY